MIGDALIKELVIQLDVTSTISNGKNKIKTNS